jgi:hypothetical protein
MERFDLPDNNHNQFLTAARMRVHWYVSRPNPGLLNAGSKGRNTASLPLQLGTSDLSYPSTTYYYFFR